MNINITYKERDQKSLREVEWGGKDGSIVDHLAGEGNHVHPGHQRLIPISALGQESLGSRHNKQLLWRGAGECIRTTHDDATPDEKGQRKKKQNRARGRNTTALRECRQKKGGRRALCNHDRKRSEVADTLGGGALVIVQGAQK